jgi:mono/diheme cytochrome c family protein
MNRTVKYVIFSIALLLCTAYVINAARSLAAPQVKKAGHKGQAAKTESLYVQHCARCHGADGRGETTLGKLYNTPNLTDAGLHASFSNKELSTIIALGRGGMPSFKKTLSKAEIAALITYVRRFKKK